MSVDDSQHNTFSNTLDPQIDELPFTFAEVEKPRGSAGLAKRFLQSYRYQQISSLKPTKDESSTDASEEFQNTSENASENENENENARFEQMKEKQQEHHLSELKDIISLETKQKELEEDAATLKYFKELLENRAIDQSQVPIVSLGTSSKTDIDVNDEKIVNLTDDAHDELMKNYPCIPVRKIDNLDIYLVAYENFLAKWKPDLKFNYTDPGRVDGHVNNLKNAIKLAFYDQYSLVRKAYLEVREQVFTDMKLATPGSPAELKSMLRKMKPAHVLLEENRIRPEMFDVMIDNVFSTLNSREILDIGNHRGHGYFLLWEDKTQTYDLPDVDPSTSNSSHSSNSSNSSNSSHSPSQDDSLTVAPGKTKKSQDVLNPSHPLYALPSIGTFGHFLPEPGFSIVKEYGWQYFRDTEIIGFQIGHVRKILIENRDGEWEDWELKGPIYLEISELEYEDSSVTRIQVDGHFFQGTIYSQVE